MQKMEGDNTADVSCRARAGDQGLLPPATGTAAAPASSALPQQRSGSSQPTLKRHQPYCTSAAFLQEHHQLQRRFQELRHDQRQQPQHSLLSHATQRRHSASEYFAQHHSLSSLSRQTEQRQYQPNNPGQPRVSQEQELRRCTPTQESVQRCWPPFPSPKRLSESASSHGFTAGHSACWLNGSPRNVRTDLPHHSSSEIGKIRNHNSGTSSSNTRAGGGIGNGDETLSTCNASAGGAQRPEGSSHGSPGTHENLSSKDSIHCESRTSTCSSMPSLNVSACIDRMGSWSSATLPGAEADAAVIHQIHVEGATVHEVVAECAAAAATRGAPRAAAASAAAQREAHAVAAKSMRTATSPGQTKAAMVVTEAVMGVTPACARVSSLRVSMAPTIAETDISRETRTSRTGKPMQDSTGIIDSNAHSDGLLAFKAAPAEKMWKLGENIWAAAIVEGSALGLANDEETAMLTLSPELDHATASNAIATPAARISATLAVADAAGVAAYSFPEEGVPPGTAVDTGRLGASALHAESASATASCAAPSPAVPQLDSVVHRSPEATSAADSPVLARALPAATSVALPVLPSRVAELSVEGDAPSAAGALESLLIWTRENDRQPAATPKSSCLYPSPKSCYTSRSSDEAQHLLLPQEDQEPLLKEQQWEDEQLLTSELKRLQTDEDLLQQPPTQHVQHWKRGEKTHQVHHTELEGKQEPSRHPRVQHEPGLRQHERYHQRHEEHQQRHERRHGQRCRPQSESEPQCQSVQEQQGHLSHVPLSMPSCCAADAEIQPCATICVDEQRGPPEQISPQLYAPVGDTQHPLTNQTHARTHPQEQKTIRRVHQRKSPTTQHQRSRPAPEHLQQAKALQQPLPPAYLGHPNGPDLRPSQKSTKERKDEQNESLCLRNEQEEDPERQQQLHPQQTSRQQAGLAGERGDEQARSAWPCCQDRECMSVHQAAVLRELQHLVQQQQAQLQQLLQQQTLLMQQLLREQSPADSRAAHHTGKGAEATTPVLLSVATNAVAEPPAPEGPAAGGPQPATFRVAAQNSPPAASASLSPVPVPQASGKPAHAPAGPPPAGRICSSRMTSIERSYCMDGSKIDRYALSNSGVFEHISQGWLQSGAAHSEAKTSETQANQAKQNMRSRENTPSQQLRAGDSQEPPAQQLVLARNLLRLEQQLEKDHQKTCSQEEHPIGQSTHVQVRPELRQNSQRLLFRNNLDGLQPEASGDNRKEVLHVSSMPLNPPLQPAPAWVPSLLYSCLSESSPMQRVCGARTVALREELPAAEIAEGALAPSAADLAVHAASDSMPAEVPAIAAPGSAAEVPAAATEVVTGARAPAATAAAWKKEKPHVQGAAASVNVQQQRDVDSSPSPSQQQRSRCESTAAVDGHPAFSHSSSGNMSEFLMKGTSLWRLSTNTGSHQQVQNPEEPRSPRMLPRQSFPLFRRTASGDEEGRPLTGGAESTLVDSAAAMSPSLAADAILQQQPSSAPELLRQQQRKLQRKLRLLQERMQQVQQEHQQRQKQHEEQMVLDDLVVPIYQRRSIGADSTVDPQLLSNTLLQTVSQQQQCQVTPQKQNAAPQQYEEYAQVGNTPGLDQGYKRGSGTGSTVLDDSRGCASGEDVWLQHSSIYGCNTATARPLRRSFNTYKPSDECSSLTPAIPVMHHADFLGKEATTPKPLPRVGTVKYSTAERTPKVQGGEFSAHAPARAVPAKLAPSAASEETLPCSGDTYGLLTPASDSNFYLPAYTYLPGQLKPVATGQGLISSAASAPAGSLLAKVGLAGGRHCSSTQLQSAAVGRGSSIGACFSVPDSLNKNCTFLLDQVCSPSAAGVARREGRTTQQPHLQCTRGSIPLHDLVQPRTAEEEGVGELGERVQPRGSRSRLLKQVSGQEPFVLPGHGTILQSQDDLQEHSHGRLNLKPQQGQRQLLDQDEQIVPSVLKRILLQQQQQQEKAGERDGRSTLSSSLALQQQEETCWWEGAASSRTSVKPRQQRHQLQTKRLTRSRPDGAGSAATTNGRPSARLRTQKDAVRLLASRQQPSAHQRSGMHRASAPCSATPASTRSSGKHLNSASSYRNIDSKQNSNRHSRTNSCSSILSSQSNPGWVTGTFRSPNPKPKKGLQPDSRARGQHHVHCNHRQGSGDQSAASPRALAAADLVQPEADGTGERYIYLKGSCSAAVVPRTESVLVTASATHAKRDESLPDAVPADQSTFPPAHLEAPAPSSKISVLGRAVGEDNRNFPETVDEESCSSGRHRQERRGKTSSDEMSYLTGSSRCSECEQPQRGDTEIPNTVLNGPRPFEDRQGGTAHNTSVERMNGEADVPSRAPPRVTQSRQQERQPSQPNERPSQMSTQGSVRRTHETPRAHRQIRPERQRRDVDIEKHGVAQEGGNELQVNGEVSRSRLLRFLEQRCRPARGQETAALVRLFLSQQEQLSAAAATAPGCRWERNIGNGIPFMEDDSRFCLEHLKHLREDSAGDAYYVEIMAKLLQRYEELTTVD